MCNDLCIVFPMKQLSEARMCLLLSSQHHRVASKLELNWTCSYPAWVMWAFMVEFGLLSPQLITSTGSTLGRHEFSGESPPDRSMLSQQKLMIPWALTVPWNIAWVCLTSGGRSAFSCSQESLTEKRKGRTLSILSWHPKHIPSLFFFLFEFRKLLRLKEVGGSTVIISIVPWKAFPCPLFLDRVSWAQLTSLSVYLRMTLDSWFSAVFFQELGLQACPTSPVYRVLGIEIPTSCVLGKHPYLLSHIPYPRVHPLLPPAILGQYWPHSHRGRWESQHSSLLSYGSTSPNPQHLRSVLSMAGV